MECALMILYAQVLLASKFGLPTERELLSRWISTDAEPKIIIL